MGIKGDVRSISLANVLQDLAMNEQTGTLRIRAKERQIALWFEKGALRLVGLGPGEGPNPMNGLLALGKLSAPEIPGFSKGRMTEGSYIRGAVKKGKISRDELKSALEHQMAEHLCDAFLWKDATFEFEEGDPDDHSFDTDQLDLEPRLAVDAVILEAVRRADEWGETRKAILSSNEILVADPHRVPPEIDGTTHRVLTLLDGERTLKEIMELTRLGQFTVLRGAALLIKGGAARPLSAADAFERARARAAKKDWPAALKMAKYGLDHERSNMGLLELAFRCSEDLQDHEAAASYARQLAAAQVETGHLEQALGSYQKVLAHAPRDLTAHERLFGLMLSLDLKLDALAAGEALAAGYKKAGLPDKALDVYKRLLEKLGDQKELLESLAEIQRHLGDKKEAIGLYRRLLAQALEKKDDDAAAEYCRTILKIDPKNEEAQKLREQLESGEMERARRRRRRLKSILAGAAGLALVALLGWYEWSARAAYGDVRIAVGEAREAQRYKEAVLLYNSVIDRYPFSLEARGIGRERDVVEARYAQEEEKHARALDDAGQLAEAEEILDVALGLVRNSDNEERLRKLREDVRVRRMGEVDKRRKKLEGMTAAQIQEGPHDVLSVRPLEEIALSDPKPERRLAAVRALGAFPEAPEPVIGALTKAISSADAAVSAAAAEILIEKGKPPLQASIVLASRSLPPRAPLAAEWRIVNGSKADIEFTIEDPPARFLEVKASKTAEPFPWSPAPARLVRLGPGEFQGGPFDLSGATVAPGKYEVSWGAKLKWRDKVIQLAAPPATFERTR